MLKENRYKLLFWGDSLERIDEYLMRSEYWRKSLRVLKTRHCRNCIYRNACWSYYPERIDELCDVEEIKSVVSKLSELRKEFGYGEG